MVEWSRVGHNTYPLQVTRLLTRREGINTLSLSLSPREETIGRVENENRTETKTHIYL